MYHRPLPTVRNSSASLHGQSRPSLTPSPRLFPLLQPASVAAVYPPPEKADTLPPADTPSGPTICGMPLKYVSLVTLAVQNATLSIVMHYSRVSTPPSRAYSPAAAVLLNEILKGSISFIIAVSRAPLFAARQYAPVTPANPWFSQPSPSLAHSLRILLHPVLHVSAEVFSIDCWKLSIPALLYVIQNSLQFVAISNLPVASFQVTYQMKILTTAAFSVSLLRKRLSSTKWLSLLFLAIGVGIVQLQTASGSSVKISDQRVGSAHDSAPLHIHVMSPLKGFAAVTAACFTSGLAGVYFEMVLKGSKTDLWVRNVQLSLFSLIPALLPIIYSSYSSPVVAYPDVHARGMGFLHGLLRNFGFWAWATVAVQVLGGLITAVVIKYSDNILKGFATSLSIVLSFLASVALFDFHITPSFVIGASTVLVSTWMYNQPSDDVGRSAGAIVSKGLGRTSKADAPFPGSPLDINDPILGELPSLSRKSSPFGSPRAMASALGLGLGSVTGNGGSPNGLGSGGLGLNGYGYGRTGSQEQFELLQDTPRYMNAPYGSPYNSRPGSRVPSRVPSPLPPSPLGSDTGGSGSGSS